MPKDIYVRLFDDLDATVFDIIDAADAKGFAGFIRDETWLPRPLPAKTDDVIRELLESVFQPHLLFTLKLSQTKKWVKDIEATRYVQPDGSWVVRLNIARFFLLPGEKPRAELAELRKFFEQMKAFYELHAQAHRPAAISFMNERDHNKRTYGSIRCSIDDVEDPETSARLQATIDASPALQHFQREHALSLQKMGPYSWCAVTEEPFFKTLDQPWRKASYARFSAEANAKKAASNPDYSQGIKF